METHVQVIFYSLYGHLHKMAEAVAEGARSVDGAKVGLFQVPELMPEEALATSGGDKARAAFAHIPVATPAQLADADALLIGAPTRFGVMAAQMKNFLDQTGALWMEGKLVDKVGGAFTGSGCQHGGQEMTILSIHTVMYHHGMVVAGVPYTEKRQMEMGEITGGSPYGASVVAAPDGSRQPSANELGIAHFLGQRVATLARQLKAGRG